MKWLGQLNYYRGKGQQWIEMIRAWITPAALGGGFAKYLGVDNWVAIVIAIVVPIAVESCGIMWGRFLYRRGAVRADYELALLMDPYKVKQVEYQDEAIRLLRRLAGHAGHPCWEQLGQNDWATAPNRRPDEQ